MRKVTRAKGNIKGRRAIIEAIEQRILLSAVVSNGVLTITGTSAADTISLNFTINGIYTATVNGVETVFQGDGIGQVVVNGLGGNDNIKIIGSDEDDASSPAPLNIAVNEGDGNDGINTSITGTGSTSPITVNITAGNGNDNIFVQGGSAATVTAGNGNDNVFVQAGTSSTSLSETGTTRSAAARPVNAESSCISCPRRQRQRSDQRRQRRRRQPATSGGSRYRPRHVQQ